MPENVPRAGGGARGRREEGSGGRPSAGKRDWPEASARAWARAGRVGLLAMVLTLPMAGCRALDDAMVAVFGRSMRDQNSFDAYENPLGAPKGSVPFAAGNFPPAPGAVSVGQPVGPPETPPPFSQTDLINQAAAVVNRPNPVPPTEASLARGEELYLRFCAPCHGPDGSGASGYIVPAGYPPFPLVTDRVRQFTDGYIYGMIRVGRGLMPSYGHRISEFDRWNVVNYVRLLQGALPSPLPAVQEGPGGGGEVGGGEGGGGSSEESSPSPTGDWDR